MFLKVRFLKQILGRVLPPIRLVLLCLPYLTAQPATHPEGREGPACPWDSWWFEQGCDGVKPELSQREATLLGTVQ